MLLTLKKALKDLIILIVPFWGFWHSEAEFKDHSKIVDAFILIFDKSEKLPIFLESALYRIIYQW